MGGGGSDVFVLVLIFSKTTTFRDLKIHVVLSNLLAAALLSSLVSRFFKKYYFDILTTLWTIMMKLAIKAFCIGQISKVAKQIDNGAIF